jgi:hypothetical protein
VAEFNVEGMDELSSAFMRHEEGAEAAVQEMLTATAEIYVQEHKAAAGGYGIRKTGGFMNSIKASTIRRDGTALVCDICPEGKTDHPAEYGGGSNKRKGKSRRGNVRYATIGFIFEYGTSSIPARPWFTQGNAKAEQKGYEKAQEIWSRYVDKTLG